MPWHVSSFGYATDTGDITAEDQQLFVVERRAFTELCTSPIQPCTCWHSGDYVLLCICSRKCCVHTVYIFITERACSYFVLSLDVVVVERLPRLGLVLDFLVDTT